MAGNVEDAPLLLSKDCSLSTSLWRYSFSIRSLLYAANSSWYVSCVPISFKATVSYIKADTQYHLLFSHPCRGARRALIIGSYTWLCTSSMNSVCNVARTLPLWGKYYACWSLRVWLSGNQSPYGRPPMSGSCYWKNIVYVLPHEAFAPRCSPPAYLRSLPTCQTSVSGKGRHRQFYAQASLSQKKACE